MDPASTGRFKDIVTKQLEARVVPMGDSRKADSGFIVRADALF